MITIEPIARALVPIDSAAADAIGAPNYDEFQDDREVWELLQRKPDCLLRITMAHCDAPAPDRIGEPDSEAALDKAASNMAELVADSRIRAVSNILWVYEIMGPARPGVRQIGLGGLARIDEIRAPANPGGSIIRNEGVREPKARGRARLVERINAFVDCVNNAVDDATGELGTALEAWADDNVPSLETTDEVGNLHRVWIVNAPESVDRFRSLLAAEPHAYVADGNHRSAAAAMLGHDHFLSVFFPARTMGIAPYNRLVDDTGAAAPDVIEQIHSSFDVASVEGPYQPLSTHDIGLYDGSRWYRLRPLSGTFDPEDAAQDIDADIVQRLFFAQVLGIDDARDKRLTFVGSNRDAAWLQTEVDAGRFCWAVTLPAVTMEQFIRVCHQNRLMPPKSTWFEPKVRTGLVMALLDSIPPLHGRSARESP